MGRASRDGMALHGRPIRDSERGLAMPNAASGFLQQPCPSNRHLLGVLPRAERPARLVQGSTTTGYERPASCHIPRQARGDGLDDLSSTHGTDRPAADGTRPGRGRPARRAAGGIEVRRGVHEPLAAGGPDVRVGWLRVQGGSRPGPARMELRRIRRPYQRRHPRRAPGLATVSRRQSGRGVAGPGRSTGGPGDPPGAGDRRRRPALFERTLPPGVRGALARARTGRGQVFPARNG